MILGYRPKDRQKNGSCLQLRYSLSRRERRLERNMIYLRYWNGSCLQLRYSLSRRKRRLERNMIYLRYWNGKLSFSESVTLLLLWWRHRSRALFDLTNFEGLHLTALQHHGTSAGKTHPSVKSTQTPNPNANKSRLLDVWCCAICACSIHQDRQERRKFSGDASLSFHVLYQNIRS